MENTPFDNSSQAQTVKKQSAPEMRGIQAGWIIRYEDVADLLGTSDETLALWKKSGLKTHRPGTRADLVETDELIAFIRAFGKTEQHPPRKKTKTIRKQEPK